VKEALSMDKMLRELKKLPLRQVEKISYATYAIGLLFILAGAALVDLIPIVLGLLVLAGGAVFLTLFHRCPHCRFWLRTGGYFCPRCGNKIDR